MRLNKLLALAGFAAGVALAGPVLAQGQDVTIGVSIPAATHGWTGGVNYHAQYAIERLSKAYPNLHFVLATASDSAKQVNDLEDMLATRNIDALVILPFESDPLTGPVKRVKQAGKFVTVVDRGLTEPGIEDLYVAGDNPGLGSVSAQYFKSVMPEGGKIVVLRGIPTVIDNQRVEAFQAGLKDTKIEILDMKHANWNRDDGFKVMQDYLSRFPAIDAVWAQDDDIALGVLEAIRQSGRNDIKFVVGGAGMKQMVERVMNKDQMVPVDVLYPPAMIGTAIELTALKFVANVPVQGRYIIASPLVTPENAKDFYYPDSPF